MSDDNLYAKLLGLDPKIENPTYFEMLEIPEGDVEGPKVEDQYKKQIQKVQRYTNNPKYKEGALFLKGELRKARGALVDEARRAAYMRELLQDRTQAIRTMLRPLLIKEYIVDEEYKYLMQTAARHGVPAPIVDQVIKQELEKKGIDPSTALIEAGSGPPRRGGKKKRKKGKALPSGPKRAKKAAPKSFTARFQWLRYFHPAELIKLETWVLFITWPLRMVGVNIGPDEEEYEGFISEYPIASASLFWVGMAVFFVGYWTVNTNEHRAKQEELRDYAQAEEANWRKLHDKIKVDYQNLKTRQDKFFIPRSKLDSANQQLDTARKQLNARDTELGDVKSKLQTANKTIGDRDKKIAELEEKLRNRNGGGADSSTVKALNNIIKFKDEQIKAQTDKIKRLEKELKDATGGNIDDAAKKRIAALEGERDSLNKQLTQVRADAQKEKDRIKKELSNYGDRVRAALKLEGLDPNQRRGFVTGAGGKVSLSIGKKERLKKGTKLRVFRLGLYHIADVEIDQLGRKTGSFAKITKLKHSDNPIETQDLVVVIKKP